MASVFFRDQVKMGIQSQSCREVCVLDVEGYGVDGHADAQVFES